VEAAALAVVLIKDHMRRLKHVLAVTVLIKVVKSDVTNHLKRKMIRSALICLGILVNSIAQAEPPHIEKVGQKLDSELACLTRNIYHEARGEPIVGQVAVGIVTLQRMSSPHYPNTICEVVYQPYAFSWTAKPHPKEDPKVFYGQCLSAARQALLAKVMIPNEFQADHYHNLSVHPYWANSKTLVAQIGNHKFYK